MRRPTGTSLTQRATGRCIAILLALLLAMVTLSSHGAMEHPQLDCGVVSEWQSDAGQGLEHDGVGHDHDAASCATCSTAMNQALLPLPGPAGRADSPAMALSPQIPLPPRRPPRT